MPDVIQLGILAYLEILNRYIVDGHNDCLPFHRMVVGAQQAAGNPLLTSLFQSLRYPHDAFELTATSTGLAMHHVPSRFRRG